MDFSPGFEHGEPDGQLDTAFSALSIEQSLERVRRDGSIEDLKRLNEIRVCYAERAQVLYECYLLDQTLERMLTGEPGEETVTAQSVREYFQGPTFRLGKREASSSERAKTDFIESERKSMIDLVRAMLANGDTHSAVATFAAASEGIDGKGVSRQSSSRVTFAQRIISELQPGEVTERNLLYFMEEALGLLQQYGSDGALSNSTLDARHDIAEHLIEYGRENDVSAEFFNTVLWKWEVADMRRPRPLASFLTHVRNSVHAATPETAGKVLDLIRIIPGRNDFQSTRREMVDTLNVVLKSQPALPQENPA